MHVGFAIAHVETDPFRRAWVREIRKEVPRASVVVDTHRSCWHTNRRAWISAARDHGATHCVAMADDQIPCRNFLTYLYGAVEAKPHSIITYFTMRNKPLLEAGKTGKSWIRTPDGAWGGVTLMPVDMMWDFLLWEGRYVDPSYPHDDMRLKFYAWKEKLPIWITAPSLTQHEGHAESLMGHATTIGGKKRRSEWVADGYQKIDWDTDAIRNSGSLNMELEFERAKRRS